MPRTAATIVGILLVAFSIGFNTSRYPIVWRMTGSSAAAAASSTSADAPAPPSSPKPIEQAEPRKEKKKEKTIAIAPSSIEAKPLPDAAKEKEKEKEKPAAFVDASASLGAERPITAGPASEERFSLASTSSDKTLTPVPRVISVERFLGEPEAAESVRRLPPVDPNVTPPALDASPLPGGAIPIYPSTGIEEARQS